MPLTFTPRTLETATTSATREPEMSIVICTLNRCDMLERAIASLQTQTCHPSSVEIIVVDNGSTDATKSVVLRMAENDARLRYVHEATLGLSHARNRGIAESRGRLVAFFDDDAEAEADWATLILATFRREPGAGAAGGPIQVRWPVPRPAWMPVSLEGYYGRCDYGRERRQLEYPQYPYGSNMIIRRDLLVSLGGFRTELGRKGQSLMAAEETDLFLRLAGIGARVFYEPAALVHHWATADRVTRTWSLRRSFSHGVSTVTMQQVNGASARGYWLRRLVQATTQVASAVVAAVVGLVTGAASATVMSRGANAIYWLGVAAGAWSSLRAPLPAASAAVARPVVVNFPAAVTRREATAAGLGVERPAA
jgi:GT2 family glycosyltransferase